MSRFSTIGMCLLIFLASFILYNETSHILIDENKEFYFGADPNLYIDIASGNIDAQIQLFHPFTVLAARAWLAVLSPLNGLISPAELLGAMFALFGAASVVAAYLTFRRLLPDSDAFPCMLAYASSLSIWYFSSIHETKIIDGTIASIYIALYVHLRSRWNIWLALSLTGVLVLGCLNSIVTAFLVAIPAVDVFLREHYKLRKMKWVILHALPVPLVFLFLEMLIAQSIGTGAQVEAEGKSHLDLLLTFAALGEHDIGSFLGFLLNWVLFSLAAPSSDAPYVYDIWEGYDAYFVPGIMPYFTNLPSALFLLSLTTMIAASIFFRSERRADPTIPFLLTGLAVYSVARLVLFYVFVPSEALLYSSPVILCHLVIVSVLFFESNFACKEHVYKFFVAMIILSNIRFLFE